MPPLDPFETGYLGWRFWRRHELGKKALRRWMPKLAAKREHVWAARAARKAARQHQPDESAGEFFNVEDGNRMNTNLLIALLGSLARHFLPAATAFLAGAGIQVDASASPWLTLSVAGAVYLAMQGVSFYRQWLKNRG